MRPLFNELGLNVCVAVFKMGKTVDGKDFQHGKGNIGRTIPDLVLIER